MPKHTQCVHSGARKDKTTRGLNTPIYPSSAYEYLDAVENTYPRYFNTPNERAVVEKLCALEGAEEGLLFSSGMAAISTVLLAFLESGGHAVLQRDIYGGTHHFATAEFNRLGIEFSFAGRRAEEIEAAIRPNTRLIYIETPSNPLLRITDIAAAAEIGRRRGLVTVIDNTFASPVNQNPIALGIDVVTHSATKYIGGHSDLCCGAALGSAEKIRRVRETAVNLGGSLNALTCYLLERSLKTLAVRVERHNRNALAVAQFLQLRPAVAAVNYPGLDTHPEHAIAARQMHGLRRHALLRAGRGALYGRAVPAPAEADHPGPEPGRGGNHHLRSVEDIACQALRGGAPGVGYFKRAAAAVGRHRGCGGYHRRHLPGLGYLRGRRRAAG
jgi:cystathionine beta-lyase/cystathionine gamma-synthase